MSEPMKTTSVSLWGAELRGEWLKDTEDCFRVDFYVEGEVVGGLGLSVEGLRKLRALIGEALDEHWKNEVNAAIGND